MKSEIVIMAEKSATGLFSAAVSAMPKHFLEGLSAKAKLAMSFVLTNQDQGLKLAIQSVPIPIPKSTLKVSANCIQVRSKLWIYFCFHPFPRK